MISHGWPIINSGCAVQVTGLIMSNQELISLQTSTLKVQGYPYQCHPSIYLFPLKLLEQIKQHNVIKITDDTHKAKALDTLLQMMTDRWSNLNGKLLDIIEQLQCLGMYTVIRSNI